MNREYLLQTTGKLEQPSVAALKEYSDNGEMLVLEMNARMLARPDINDLVGENNLDMMRDNHANHVHFMQALFTNYQPAVLVDTVIWVFRAYRSRNFSSRYWAAQLNGWMNLFREELSAECCAEILPFYKWMKVNIPVFNQLAEADIDADFSSH